MALIKGRVPPGNVVRLPVGTQIIIKYLIYSSLVGCEDPTGQYPNVADTVKFLWVVERILLGRCTYDEDHRW